MLIFVMPLFYSMAVDGIRVDMTRKELREIADYVSNTLANLYFLVNSTEYTDVSMEKLLIYLPSTVENSVYVLKIVGSGEDASEVTAYLKDRPSVLAEAWLSPGLKLGAQNTVESSAKTVVAGCSRNGTGVYVWIKYV